MVSVIIPSYNRAGVITRAIRSVQEQTYEDWELIVVDDGSRDNTEEIVRSFDDDRIRFIRHEYNVGGAAARNTGIRESDGDVIAFLDSDDEWQSKKLQAQVNVLEQCGPDTAVVYCRSALLLNGTMIVPGPRSQRMRSGNVLSDLLLGWCPPTTSMFVVRRSAFERAGLFDEALPSFQDYDMWLRLAKHYMFDYVDDVFVLRHDDGGGQITKNYEARLDGTRTFFSKWESEVVARFGQGKANKIKTYMLSRVYRNAIKYDSDNAFSHILSLYRVGGLTVTDVMKGCMIKVFGYNTLVNIKNLGLWPLR